MGLQAGEYFASKPLQITLGQFLGTLLLQLSKRLVDGRIGLRIVRAAHALRVQFDKGRWQGFRAVRALGQRQSLSVQLIKLTNALDPAIRPCLLVVATQPQMDKIPSHMRPTIS
jgi:hypothetical protein